MRAFGRIAVAAAALCSPADAQVDVALHGFADSYHAAAVASPNELMSSRTRLRTELEGYAGESRLYVSTNIERNDVARSLTGARLHEAFLEGAGSWWDARIGRQIIIWGGSDGLPITDIVSPQDMTEFLAREYDDVRMPVDALRVRLLGNRFTTELLWLPVFEPAILPQPGSPWWIPGMPAEDSSLPARTLENGEFGGQVQFRLSGLDFAVCALRTWSDEPVYEPVGADEYELDHPRVTMFGGDVAKPVGAFVWRGEAAVLAGVRYHRDDPRRRPSKHTTIKALAGFDWYPTSDWTLNAQVADRWIAGHESSLAEDEHTVESMASVSRSLLRERLELSATWYAGFTNGDGFCRLAADYAFTDDLHVSCGTDRFFGDDGAYSAYDDNDEVFLRARFTF